MREAFIERSFGAARLALVRDHWNEAVAAAQDAGAGDEDADDQAT